VFCCSTPWFLYTDNDILLENILITYFASALCCTTASVKTVSQVVLAYCAVAAEALLAARVARTARAASRLRLLLSTSPVATMLLSYRETCRRFWRTDCGNNCFLVCNRSHCERRAKATNGWCRHETNRENRAQQHSHRPIFVVAHRPSDGLHTWTPRTMISTWAVLVHCDLPAEELVLRSRRTTSVLVLLSARTGPRQRHPLPAGSNRTEQWAHLFIFERTHCFHVR